MCCIFAIVGWIIWSLASVVAFLMPCVLSIVAFVGACIFLMMVYKRTFSGYEPDGRFKTGWFGRGTAPTSDSEDDTSIRPFKINVPDEVLEDLKYRLEKTRFEDPVEDSKFLYGFNPNYLRKLVEYWKKEYDWREHEKMLNQFPQFKTRIEGLDVHFLHVKPELPENSKLRVVPLMVIHGWPGSIVEFYKFIPLLTTPRPGYDFVFEVVCPSIPGYGFSESPHREGFNMRAAARIFLTLMERIGHRKFYVQGGDWGSGISQVMARFYSPRIKGMHVNFCFCTPRPWDAIKFVVVSFFPFLLDKDEAKLTVPITKLIKRIYAEGGYFHLQSTKPDTIGCAMADSPAGMAAYLIEKFSYWANPEYIKREDGGLTEKFTLDELLTNAMLYWVNNNFAAAARFYKENVNDPRKENFERLDVTIPTGIAVFPNELMLMPKFCMTQQMKNIVSYNVMPRGGHFAALEEPELLADDVWQFVKLAEK